MEEIFKRKEAAEFLKVPVRTIDYLVRTGQIPYSRIGKRLVRFNRDRLIAWVAEREGVEYRYSKSAAEK